MENRARQQRMRLMLLMLLLLLLLLTAALAAPQGTPTAPSPPRSEREGVIVYLTDGSAPRLADLAASLASLDASFNARAEARYPVVVFYDADAAAAGEAAPLPPGAAAALAAASAGPLTFVAVDLAALVPAAALAAAPRVLDYPGVGSFSLGYRLMCNFFAAPVAAQRALAPYRYYLRLDTDSRLLAPLADPFHAMAARSWRYGYISSQCEWPGVAEGLAEAAAELLGGAAGLPREFTDDSCPRGAAPPGAWNHRILYNNFEVVELAWLRSPAYTRWYEGLVARGGIMSRRWGDAPIRTLAVFALLPPAQVHRFAEAVYWHQGLLGDGVPRLVRAGALLAIAAAAALVVRLLPRRRRPAGAAAAAGAVYAARSKCAA